MKKKQTIIAAVVLMLVLLVGGLIAYFTDTETKTNVFTIGKVKIDLTEPNWDPDDAEDLMPNAVVPKDPIVTNDGTDEGSTSPAYVFVKVEVPCYTTSATATPANTTAELFTFTPNSGWTQLSHTMCASSSAKSEYVFYYGTNGSLTPLAVDATTPAVFNNVTLANIDGSETMPASIEMPVTAYGIQTEGIAANDPATAYGSF